jgi:hypothetical protein
MTQRDGSVASLCSIGPRRSRARLRSFSSGWVAGSRGFPSPDPAQLSKHLVDMIGEFAR